MAGEIASAFVRIRPNMTGFKAETESGVSSAFSGIAKIVGVAFGAGEAFRFGKGLVEGAASSQKQVQAVTDEFGKASGAVKQFGANAAAALGISSTLADTTSARFGTMFQNLGIGQGAAARMTINLEKLAGSLASIRGVDPAAVLAMMPSALLGSTRGLKQLGISIDGTQIKLAALKLGLISNVTQALSPAVKAEAIYALATANLGKIQAQAKTHANDFANVQRRLSAEWSNAKGILGNALLPEFTKLAHSFEGWVSRMQKSGALQRDFNTIGRDTAAVVKNVASVISVGFKVFQTVAGWVGGAKDALIILFGVLAINKIRRIAGSITTDLINNGIKKIGPTAVKGSAEYDASMTSMKLATIGLGVTIRTALIETGIGALVLAISFAVTYIITHWDTVKRYTVALAAGIVATWNGLKTTLLGIAEVIGGGMATQLTLPFKALLEGASLVSGFLGHLGIHIGGSVKDAQKLLDSFTTSLVKKGISNVSKGGGEVAHAFGKAWSDSLAKSAKAPTPDSTVKALTDLGKGLGGNITDGLVKSAAAVPPKVGTAVAKGMQSAINAANQVIQTSISSAKNNLDKIGSQLAASVNKLLDKIGVNGPAGAAQKQAIARLQKLIQSGAPGFAITRASQELSSDLQSAGRENSQSKTAAHAAVTKSIADITDAFNTGKINVSTLNKRIAATLKKDKVSYKLAGKELGSAFADAFRSEIGGLSTQAGAIAAVPAKLRGTGGGGGAADIKIIRPLEVIRRENQLIATKAERQRATQIKAAERTAKAAEKTATQVAALKGIKVGALPGTTGKRARDNAKSGVKP